ncbi:MAG: DUF1697 domain-containing protein [Candidatus Wallbacteria bacterium]|nr:DUF1697 domain-containing protein [Candidatus Wallbacteria bacterium]
MAIHVALLRAINVGGTGKLAMRDLRLLCENAGFASVRTYIQSGNAVFESPLAGPEVEAKLEEALETRMGKRYAVFVRSAAELERIVERNSFRGAAPNRVLVHFLREAPASDSLAAWPVPGKEELALDGREVLIHFPEGMGRSKLKVPFAKLGTGRNLSTVTQLAAMAREMEK